MNKTIILLISVFIILSSCKKDDDNNEPSAGFPVETIDHLEFIIDSIMQRDTIYATIIGIWVPGRGEFVSATGVANMQEGRLVETTDLFRIASNTKTFTGIRILQMHDQGLLDIHDPISKYYPDFPNAENITLKNLLHMQSGMADFANHAFLEQWYEDPLLQLSIEEEIQICAADSASFYAPGGIVRYNNTNYIMLGDIITRISGNSLQHEYNEYIFKPLGMNNTYYPTDNNLPGNYHGYSWNTETHVFDDMTILNPAIPNASGGIISDIYDLKTYVKALYNGDLISDSLHQQQLQFLPFEGAPPWMGYGMGILNFGGFWGHNGTIFGFSTEMYYMPELDATIIINVNRLDLNDHSKSYSFFIKLTKELFPDYVQW